jgi:hypothetical protein
MRTTHGSRLATWEYCKASHFVATFSASDDTSLGILESFMLPDECTLDGSRGSLYFTDTPRLA